MEQHFNRAQMVYIAQLTAKKAPLKGQRAEFEVIEIFKGNPGNFVELQTRWGGGDCGIPFNVGSRYAVYQGASNRIDMCDGSKELYTQDLYLRVTEKLRAIASSKEEP